MRYFRLQCEHHFVYIEQGMLNARADVVKNAETLMSLWKHECCRVIADRFISQDDRSWFEKTLKQVKILKQNNGNSHEVPALLCTNCYEVPALLCNG